MNRKNDQKETNRGDAGKIEKSSSNVFLPVKTSLFGVNITNDVESNILEYVIRFVENTNENCYIVTPNPEIIVFAIKHKDFKNILNRAHIALCDGVGLLLAGKVLGNPCKSSVNKLLKSL
jgi:UDP-N-acetyl-D-mannosaminuronic acid transferase (WecB/TagA/CpsF family)